MSETEERLGRLRERAAKLKTELERVPTHLAGGPWETDRRECLERTRRQIAETKNRTWTASLAPRPPKPVADPLEVAGLVDPLEAIKGRIQGLQEELARIPAHPWNHQRIADRELGIRLCEQQAERIQRKDSAFLTRRAELAARFYAYRDQGGR
jgi:hypothetical protein